MNTVQLMVPITGTLHSGAIRNSQDVNFGVTGHCLRTKMLHLLHTGARREHAPMRTPACVVARERGEISGVWAEQLHNVALIHICVLHASLNSRR